MQIDSVLNGLRISLRWFLISRKARTKQIRRLLKTGEVHTSASLKASAASHENNCRKPTQAIECEGQWLDASRVPPNVGRIAIICQNFDWDDLLAERLGRTHSGHRSRLDADGLAYHVLLDKNYAHVVGPWPTVAPGLLSLNEAMALAQAQSPGRIYWARPQSSIRPPGFVFISHSYEDRDYAQRLGTFLRAYGIRVVPGHQALEGSGVRWREQVSESLANGGSFVACFSKSYHTSLEPGRNDELELAVHELARARNTSWFVPMRIGDRELPRIRIAIDCVAHRGQTEDDLVRRDTSSEDPGRTVKNEYLSDLQWIDASVEEQGWLQLLRHLGGNAIVLGEGAIESRLVTAARLWDEHAPDYQCLLSGKALLLAQRVITAPTGKPKRASLENDWGADATRLVAASLRAIGGVDSLATAVSGLVPCSGPCGLRYKIANVAICTDCFNYECSSCVGFGVHHQGCSGEFVQGLKQEGTERLRLTPREGQWIVRRGHWIDRDAPVFGTPQTVLIIGSTDDFWRHMSNLRQHSFLKDERHSFLNAEGVCYFVVLDSYFARQEVPPWFPASPGFLSEEDAMAFAEVELNDRIYWEKDYKKIGDQLFQPRHHEGLLRPSDPERIGQRRGMFVSYMREDEPQVECIAEALRGHGIQVWFDRSSIRPGEFWNPSIGEAIRNSALFLAFFSRHYSTRVDSYMKREIQVALDEVRYRRDASWLIPIRLSQTELPDALLEANIGALEARANFDWVDCLDTESGVTALIRRVRGMGALLSGGRIEERLTTAARLWEENGRSDFLISGDVLLAAQWFLGASSRGENHETDDGLLRSYVYHCMKRAGGDNAYHSRIYRRGLCDKCGEVWKVEKLAVCTGCFRFICRYCSADGTIRKCECGGPIVG